MSQISKVELARLIATGVRWVSSASMVGTICLTTFCLTTGFAAERDPLAVKGLGYSPRQSNVAYDKVAETDVDFCTSKYETRNGFEGLVIYSPDGQPLRRFADRNGDKKWINGVTIKMELRSIVTSTAISMVPPTNTVG